jgi:glycosyltransferase involved in cell wall biosynthesis
MSSHRHSRFVLVESCNFVDFPAGGQLSFARQLLAVFGDELALVGIATDDTPVGVWTSRTIDGVTYRYFAMGRRQKTAARPLVPERIRSLLELRRHRRAILGGGDSCFFTQAPELLMELAKWPLASLCYQFPGVENPLRNPRYPWGKLLATRFDRQLFSSLGAADTILAAADAPSIERLVARSHGLLQQRQVKHFPTRVDTDFFRPQEQAGTRQRLGIEAGVPVVVVSGRINRVKGYPLLLDAFRDFRSAAPQARLIFVGDGEDRPELESRASALGLVPWVTVTGFLPQAAVRDYLNAADLIAVGSHNEGWSVAMLEALACGKALVSTEVSGAREMILEGRNGFVVPGRESGAFAAAMARALELPAAAETSLARAKSYALGRLKDDLLQLWPPQER